MMNANMMNRNTMSMPGMNPNAMGGRGAGPNMMGAGMNPSMMGGQRGPATGRPAAMQGQQYRRFGSGPQQQMRPGQQQMRPGQQQMRPGQQLRKPWEEPREVPAARSPASARLQSQRDASALRSRSREERRPRSRGSEHPDSGRSGCSSECSDEVLERDANWYKMCGALTAMGIAGASPWVFLAVM